MPVDFEENARAMKRLASTQPNASVDPGISVVPAGPVSSEPVASLPPSPGMSVSPEQMMSVAGPVTSPPSVAPVMAGMPGGPAASSGVPFMLRAPENIGQEDISKSVRAGGPGVASPATVASPSLSAFLSDPTSDYVPTGPVLSPSQPASKPTTPVVTKPKAPTNSSKPAVQPGPSKPTLGQLKEEVLTSPTEMGKLRQLELANQADAGEQIANAQEDHRVRMDAFDLAKKQREDERLQRESQVQADIDQAQKEAAEFQVRDGNFLSRNPGAIFAVLASVFGGALSARTGQQNAGLQTLDAMINRDIQSQRDQLAQKNAKAAGLTNSLGRMRELFKDQRAAEMAEELSIRQSVNNKIENIIQSSKNQQLRDQGAMALKEGRTKEAQLRVEVAQREANARAAQAAEERKTQLEFIKMARAHAYKMAEEGPAKFDKEQEKLKQTYVPGYGFAARPEDASAIKRALAVKNLVAKHVPGIIEAYKNLGPTGRILDINGEQSAIEQKLNILVGQIKNEVSKAGTSMTESEKPLNGITVDDVKDWFDVRGRVTGKLATFQQLVEDNVNSQLQSASIERGHVVNNVPNPFTGEPMPYYVKEGSVLQDIPRIPELGRKETP